MNPVAAILPCGTRLHLQHGPIDLIIGADGARQVAFEAAEARFRTVLQELVGELDQLRQPITPDHAPFAGRIARRMARAVRPHSLTFVTPMAAVAGSVADEILNTMRHATPLPEVAMPPIRSRAAISIRPRSNPSIEAMAEVNRSPGARCNAISPPLLA